MTVSAAMYVYALVLCIVTSIVGALLAARFVKPKLSFVSWVGFVFVSGFCSFVLTLIVHVLFPISVFLEALICGFIYSLGFIKSWERLGI